MLNVEVLTDSGQFPLKFRYLKTSAIELSRDSDFQLRIHQKPFVGEFGLNPVGDHSALQTRGLS